MDKKKKVEDKQQKSIASFIEKAKPKKQVAKKKPAKAKPSEKIEKKPEKTKVVAEGSGEIPDELYFKGNETPFGLKEDIFEIKQIEGESYAQRYLRYLVEKGEIVQDLEKGLLLDVDYDGGQNKAYCKFYDLETDEIKIWIDTKDHKPYCLSKEPKTSLDSNITLTNYDGFVRTKNVTKFELITDKEIPMTKIYGKTPLDIGGYGENIRNILGGAWEADIRYHLNYIYDTGLIPGLIYRIKNGIIEKIEYREHKAESERIADELLTLFKEEETELQQFAEKYLDIFLTPIHDIKRMALDIEVSMSPTDFIIPDPVMAKQKVISVSFVATDGLSKVYVLERPGFTYGRPHERFPLDAKITFFKSEKELLTEVFRLIWKYPIIITFNGDNFDLNYLFHRANKLKIDRDLNPITFRRGYGPLSRAECNLRKGIHVDVFNLFSNRSISGYAFGGSYERNSLEAISTALLGEGKYKHEEEIHEMEYNILAWYNLKDSILTLDLTKFNNSLVWNLIILICRMTKMPIHDMLRHQISAWIQNIFYFEHRQNNYLIPRRSDISESKKGGHSKATIEGKGYAGAYVVKPVPGIHYDVVVMDFASLYPSIIKEKNLSYETVLCPHEDCTENLVKDLPYHVCTHKMGIFAYVVGFFRDIRVKYFKPKSADKSLSEERRSYFNTIQQALKVFINASYGVFGSQNFPLYCLPVAESITGIGQYSIKATIEKSKEIGVKVLYGDTDSVFLSNPTEIQMESISKWSKEKLDLDLEEEKTYQFLALSQRKKNYVGIYKETGYIDLKGVVAKKRNTPEFIKKIFNQVIDILKTINNDKEFAKARKTIIDIIKENRKKIGKKEAFEFEDYFINIVLQKKIDSYIKTVPQYVRAARKLRDLGGKIYQKGETISFIKSNDKIGAKVKELATFKDLDVKKYRKLLRSALEQLLDALDIDYQEILLTKYEKKEDKGSIKSMEKFL